MVGLTDDTASDHSDTLCDDESQAAREKHTHSQCRKQTAVYPTRSVVYGWGATSRSLLVSILK